MVYNVFGPRNHVRKIVRRTRVLLNGTDVTRRCFYADPRRGVVRLWLLNAEGLLYSEDGRRAARGKFRGRVEVKAMR